ncbi:MAG TPA: MFS transporter, partial [Acidobacteriota bacterium]
MTRPSANLSLFLSANFFWSLGLMVFFLLYNLHLATLGFSAALMGQVFAIGTLGTVLGSIPAGWGADRGGPKLTLIVSAMIVAASLIWRSAAVTPELLLASSFTTGMGISFWIVSVPTFLAANSGVKEQSPGFSSAYGFSILTGGVAGICGGYLPGWIGMRASLMACGVCCGIAILFLAVIEQPKTAIDVTPAASRAVVAEGGSGLRHFLFPFLAMVLVWDLLLGMFPPFFNIFFTQRHGLKVSQLGWVFSAAQFLQAAAVLSLPLWLAQLGLRRTISACQFFCFPFFALLAASTKPAWATSAYLGSATLQALTSPMIDQFMMANVTEAVRG